MARHFRSFPGPRRLHPALLTAVTPPASTRRRFAVVISYLIIVAPFIAPHLKGL